MAERIGNLIRKQLFKTKTIAASGSFTTDAIVTSELLLEGNITLQIALTGTGTMKVEWLLSNDYLNEEDQGTFIIPTSETAPISSFTASSGVAANGTEFVDLSMTNNNAFKLKFTETGGANAIVVTATLNVQ